MNTRPLIISCAYRADEPRDECSKTRTVVRVPRLSPHEILDAIRSLSDVERRDLIDELISRDFVESPADLDAIEQGLDQAERGQLIDHADLSTYMAVRRKDRRRA